MVHNRHLRGTFVFLGVFLAFSVQSFAQNFHFSVFGGWNQPGKVTLANVRSGLNGNSMLGIRLETDFARIVGWENTFAYSPNFGKPDILSTTNNSRALIYSSNLVLNAPIKHFVPYATVGAGLVTSKRILLAPSQLLNPKEFGTTFAVNYGGGLKLTRLAGPMGLRFDVRGYTLPDVFSQRLNILEVSGGIMFSF
jgi:hypothetical protein